MACPSYPLQASRLTWIQTVAMLGNSDSLGPVWTSGAMKKVLHKRKYPTSNRSRCYSNSENRSDFVQVTPLQRRD
jgi:hypothetical protein